MYEKMQKNQGGKLTKLLMSQFLIALEQCLDIILLPYGHLWKENHFLSINDHKVRELCLNIHAF